ncbi:hemerythrin domain-containing protein [Paractinoplanes deccanensis]|uniref:hemerythrin domain-containing protein n=1 Tax=Paractinoplanes deccanensis TaxID=113561 RepID=UPI001940506D|nr:hemerythrin domain-containing protein [Actinoplanes deccanensis]
MRTEPHTQELVVIHRVFRREAALLSRFVTGCRPGDTARAAQVAGAVRGYTGGLLCHHRVEDELVWPLLRERARLYDELVQRMEDQHGRLEKSLLTIGDLLPRWELAAAGHVRDELAEHLTEHRALLVEHLDDEEELILPLVAEHLSAAEWDGVGRRALGTTTLGAILEEAGPDERRHFLAKVPPADRLGWWLIGRRQYQRQVSRLREPQPW